VDGVTGGRSSSLCTPSPVRIGVTCQRRVRRIGVVNKTEREGALDVAEGVKSGFPVEEAVAAAEASEVTGGGREVGTAHGGGVHDLSHDLSVGMLLREGLFLRGSGLEVDSRGKRGGARRAVGHGVGVEDSRKILLQRKGAVLSRRISMPRKWRMAPLSVMGNTAWISVLKASMAAWEVAATAWSST
jgi:hypothetical protein